MRDSSLAVEQFDAALLCYVHGSQGLGYEAGNFWALGAAACFGVLLNAISQTRDMKALVIGTQVIDSQRGLRVFRHRLDVRGSQTWRRAVKFKRGGGGAATLRPSIPSIHLSGEKIFTLPT